MKLFYLLGLWFMPLVALAQPDTAYVTDKNTVLLENTYLSVLKDQSGHETFEKIKTVNAFHPSTQPIPNMGTTKAAVWIKFTVFNQTDQPRLLVNLMESSLNEVSLYYPVDRKGNYNAIHGGNLMPVSSHKYRTTTNVFSVPVAPYSYSTIYMRIKTTGQMVLPVFVGSEENVITSINDNRLIFGIYLGIIFIMLFYNFFIYLSTKDISYIYYIGFIFCVGFTQICLSGYGYLYLWNRIPFISLQSVNWSGVLSAIASIIFTREFLNTPKNTPLADKVLLGLLIVDLFNLLLTLAGIYNITYILIDIIAFIGSFTIWGIAGYLAFKGHRQAKFFLIAWSFFLLSVILFVVKDFGIVPYNFLTSNILLFGSSIEIALLSFALADKINTYKLEKELLQARALQSSLEKEQFVKEQNIILEAKIQERTQKLQQINRELNTTLNHLKETQSQLVDAEKMASLGQLTAGIAHEINNPINFVKSNIRPLQLDIDDLKSLISRYEEINEENLAEKLDDIQNYKEEIEYDYLLNEISTLLAGIEDGATRTADIVKGLRIFSRVDESELKEADIHEGIDTTLMLLNNTLNKNIAIVRHYAELPLLECYPGKLNQVFMNLLTNGIQAVKSKGDAGGEITITTSLDKDQAIIKIKDTGIGIPKSIMEKIFDPFFTTKDIGEGTGLGLSIVYSIIEKHQGSIEAVSEEGIGTEFIITLPVRQSHGRQTGPQELSPEKMS